MKTALLLLSFSFMLIHNSFAQIKSCACKYESTVASSYFLEKRDSIESDFLRKFDSVVVVGLNSYNWTNFIIVAFKKGSQEVSGYKFLGMKVVLDTNQIKKVNVRLDFFYRNINSILRVAEKKKAVTSHDYGIFVGLKTKTRHKGAMICSSQISLIRGTEIGMWYENLVGILNSRWK